MKSIAITEFKARCLALLEGVARTGQGLVVTKRGRPLARVMPTGGGATDPQHTLFGTVEILGDVIAPVLPARSWNAVRGVSLPSPRKTKVRKRSR